MEARSAAAEQLSGNKFGGNSGADVLALLQAAALRGSANGGGNFMPGCGCCGCCGAPAAAACGLNNAVPCGGVAGDIRARGCCGSCGFAQSSGGSGSGCGYGGFDCTSGSPASASVRAPQGMPTSRSGSLVPPPPPPRPGHCGSHGGGGCSHTGAARGLGHSAQTIVNASFPGVGPGIGHPLDSAHVGAFAASDLEGAGFGCVSRSEAREPHEAALARLKQAEPLTGETAFHASNFYLGFWREVPPIPLNEAEGSGQAAAPGPRRGEEGASPRDKPARFKVPELCRYGIKCNFKYSCTRCHGDRPEHRVNCHCDEERCLCGHPHRAGRERGPSAGFNRHSAPYGAQHVRGPGGKGHRSR